MNGAGGYRDEQERLLAGLFRASGAAEYGITSESFERTLGEIASRCLPPDSGVSQRCDFFRGLRAADLALARACAAGNELAWERFVARFRETLYAAARAITRDESTGREIAGALYSNLFGTRSDAEGRRVSKLESYNGRGSLEGWLRAVLAREYADGLRTGRKLISFESALESGAQFAAPDAARSVSREGRLDQAVDEALAGISADERFILAAYYLDDRTLTEIARMLGVHESTVSRRLEKIKTAVRKRSLRNLRAAGLDARQAAELLEDGFLELNVDVRGRLLQGKDGPTVLMNKPYE